MTLLLCDVGNSRVKTVTSDANDGVAGAPCLRELPDCIDSEKVIATDARDLSADLFRRIFRQQAGIAPSAHVDTVWVSSVRAGGGNNEAIITAARNVYDAGTVFAYAAFDVFGMSSDYDVTTIGVDRFLAMLGARGLFSEPCVVADCGTVTTIDLLDASGHHSGGLIMPGLGMMRRGLHADTDGLPPLDELPRQISPGEGGRILMRDTRGAMEQGCRAALRYAIAGVAKASGVNVVVITGGDAGQIRDTRDAQDTQDNRDIQWQHRPYLVLEGLAYYAQHVRGKA